MKRRWYFSILLVLLFITVLSGCGFFHWRGRTPDYEKHSYNCKNSLEIRDIVVDNDDVPVEVCNSEDNEIYFTYYLADDQSNQYEIGEKDGVLNIQNKSKPNYGIFIFGDETTSDSYKNVKLKLFIPCDYSGGLSVKTLDGDIRLHDISVKSLNIATNDGNILFEDTNIKGHMYCKTRDGDIQGTLAGASSEYSLITKSSDNDSNINFGKKIIELVTEDGNINISFNNI